MNTRVVVAVAVVGAVLFGVAALALSSGGGKQPVAAEDQTAVAGSGLPTGNAGTSSRTSSAATPTPVSYEPSGVEGAVSRATPPIPPDETYLVARGGDAFTMPLHSWSGIGDRFGAERGSGMMHGGIDFRLEGRANVDVIASCSGSVTGADENSTYGLYMAVDCGDGWTTVYADLVSVSAKRGDRVSRGETIIARAGPGHLHFELRWRRVPVDPEPYLKFSSLPGAGSAVVQSSGEGIRTETLVATNTPSATPTATKTATQTAVPSGGGGGSNPEPTQPAAPPTETPRPATATPRPPTATRTPIPPMPTSTNTPTPQPPAPTRTATPRPVIQ